MLLGRCRTAAAWPSARATPRTLLATLPPAKAGQYRIIVRTDIFNEVYEGVDERNNTTAAPDALTSSRCPSCSSACRCRQRCRRASSGCTRSTVGANETLRFTLDSSRRRLSANEIYVRYGDVPSGFAFDCVRAKTRSRPTRPR